MKKPFKKSAVYAVLLALVLMFSLVYAVGCGDDDETPDDPNPPVNGSITEDPNGQTGDGIPETPDEQPDDGEQEEEVTGFAIPLSDLTTTPKFFGTTVNGTYMEVIAFKYNNEYRTSFNTCYVCKGSRNAYFQMSGNQLQCQNCGNKFQLSVVGVETNSRSCHPIAIANNDRTITSSSIVISNDILANYREYFVKWKNN